MKFLTNHTALFSIIIKSNVIILKGVIIQALAAAESYIFVGDK